MDRKMKTEIRPSLHHATLHPRVRSMLNIMTGPSTVLAELHASVRIPRTTVSDENMVLYPLARTLRDARASTEHSANVIDWQAMATYEQNLPTPSGQVQEARSKSELEEPKGLEGCPKMHQDAPAATTAERRTPGSEFSVFVQLDAVPEDQRDVSQPRANHTEPDNLAADSSQEPWARLLSDAGQPNDAMRRRDLVTMTIPADKVEELAAKQGIASVEIGDGVRRLQVTQQNSTSRPSTLERRFRTAEADHDYGRNIIVGVIDVEGFDFAHEDFLTDDGGGTRFLSIWDQAGDPSIGSRPSPFIARADDAPRVRQHFADYGAEIRREHMNRALDASRTNGIPATTLEPQTSMLDGSHGTHVASIAAGNRGVCRHADIVGVSLALADGDHDRRRSFYDTTRLAQAVDYILEIAKAEGRPATINISLGTNGHSHDRSAAISRWIDYALATPGRAVTVAAGNAGQTESAPEGGIGHLLGRIHATGRIGGRDLREEVRWQVFGNGLVDISTNEMEIWYPAQDLFQIQLTAPDGEVFGPISPGEELVNFPRQDNTRISIHNDRYHPVNGFNRISIFLTPYFATNNAGATAVNGVEAGDWTVQLIGEEIRDGTWHAWIERDDPVIVDNAGPLIAFFPSAFAEGSYDPTTQISTLACGDWVNSVANLDAGMRIVNASSSHGPTRTGDPKPDLCAPGTDIVAANGFAGGWVSMTGTSMASPFVAGVVGLMLALDDELTAAQISSILRRTAAPLPGHTFEWQDAAGFGTIDPTRALQETRDFMAARARGQS